VPDGRDGFTEIMPVSTCEHRSLDVSRCEIPQTLKGEAGPVLLSSSEWWGHPAQ